MQFRPKKKKKKTLLVVAGISLTPYEETGGVSEGVCTLREIEEIDPTTEFYFKLKREKVLKKYLIKMHW